ncbi:MAG: helix-turn-helix transcriptional regulator [Rhodobacteraceae bacterium]|nr:helix-turn-helix transcriptional regulator [Paracoccaceae bacterium]
MPDPLADLITHLGTPGFGPALMRLLHRETGADLCSVFAVDGTIARVLVAESAAPEASAFARIASLRYAQRYWRRDTSAVAALGRAHRAMQVLKRPAQGIRDIDYRHECYTEGAVVERLSLYRAGAPGIIANAYRARGSGPFAPDALRAFAGRAEVLHAALLRHDRLLACPADPLAILSVREAQVARLTARGEDQPRIAAALGVSAETVTTYRKRAYAKLGIVNRHQLRALIADAD